MRPDDNTNDVPITEELPAEDVAETAETPESESAETTETPDGAVLVKPKRKVVSIVISSVCLALVAFLLFVAITLMVDKFANKSPVPRFFGVATLTVETGSMAGTIDEGDLIVIKDTGDYKIGDIITFMPEGATIPTTHRIIRIDEEKGYFYTKGDANNAEDTRPCTAEQIIGEWQFTIPHVGLFVRWLAEEWGWLCIVAIAAVIIVGVVLLRRIPSDKKEE